MQQLPRKQLGTTGIEISQLGLGTVKLGRNQGVKYPDSFSIPSDKEASTLLSLARELGINLIDTAPAYGNSEERLGHLLKGQRHDWVICSKVGEEFENGMSKFDFTPEHTRFSVERSLKRLDTDVIDIVLVHSNGDDETIINTCGTLEALEELKASGKIRAFGMSTKTVAGGLMAAAKSDAVMITWNLQHEAEIPVVDYCHQQGKGVFIKKALASGHIMSEHSKNPGLESFTRIFSHPGVTSAIVGTITPSHLKENAANLIQAISGPGFSQQ